jgi:serine/threonine protein kinase
MEFVEHGDLRNYMERPISEGEVQTITAQLVDGLQCMHGEGYVHRDLKPAVGLLASSFGDKPSDAASRTSW